MSALQILVALALVIAIVLFVIALVTPAPRARDWSYGFCLLAVTLLAFGDRVVS